MPLNIIRPAGNLEKISTARHSLGLLRSVAVTATYHAPFSVLNDGDILPICYRALHKVVAQHPALSCGIVNEDLPNPAFIRLDQIDLRQCVFLRHIAEHPLVSYPKAVEEILSSEHSILWPDLSSLPTWKLLIIPHPTSGNSPFALVDLIFLFHHALIDGLSGVAFHRALLVSLNRAHESESSDPIIPVSQSIDLPPSVENSLKLQVTYRKLLSEAIAAYLPAWLLLVSSSTDVPWTGANAALPTDAPYVSRVRTITISASRLRNILQECKKAESTLTALLHGIIVLCLAQLRPDASGFSASTPYSARKFTGASASDIVNQVSLVLTTYPRRLTVPIQSVSWQSTPASAFAIGRQLLSDIQESQAKFPVDNMLSLLPYLADFQAYFRRKLGQSRGATFEVSNLGVFRPNPNETKASDDSLWSIGSMLFSQNGSVVGNALSFNCVSVDKGPFVVSLTWQQGAVEDSLAEELQLKVEQFLNEIGSGNCKG